VFLDVYASDVSPQQEQYIIILLYINNTLFETVLP